MISANLKKSVSRFKSSNKKALLEGSNLESNIPLIGFIGRFAIEKGADAVVGVRFTTSMVMQGASEMLAYGTAVKLK